MKRSFLYFIFGLFIGSLLMVCLIFFGLPALSRKANVVVPDVAGLPLDKAITMITDSNLQYTVSYISFPDSSGVVKTNPLKDAIVKEQAVIEIIMPTLLQRMPNYVGENYYDVFNDINQLYKNEAKVVVVEEVDNSLPEGQIIRQMPAYEEPIDDMIVITISKTEKRLVVPNMIGWSLIKLQRFEKQEDIFIEYDYVYSTEEENTVVSQSINEGVSILKNGQNYLRVQISKGIAEYVPDFSNWDIESSIYVAKLLGIDYEIEYVYNETSVNKVMSQVNDGTFVVLYVATDKES